MAAIGPHILHTTTAGERWDQIAARYYGNGALTDILTAANTHLFLDTLSAVPSILEAGTKIVVPILEEQKADPATLPPWRR